MGKEYESSTSTDDFIKIHSDVLPEVVRVTKPGGSICWQVGYHVKNNSVVPLDYLVFEILRGQKDLVLRNRIVWTFGHGYHCPDRFSGRHEIVLWFTKGHNFTFNLDAVRVPQKYPGKKASKGPRKGQFSGNPKGKNPSDVWDIPNVKANHIEKTIHPCQFPVALAQRFVRTLTSIDDVVFDPFSGVCSTGVAALLEKRKFVGAELSKRYAVVGSERLERALSGAIEVRPLDREIYVPNERDAVARKPPHFWTSSLQNSYNSDHELEVGK